MTQVRIIPSPAVTRAYGRCGHGLDRVQSLAVWMQLYDDLETSGDFFRQFRAAEDPHSLFEYIVDVPDGDRIHRFTFLVNDTTAAGYFVTVHPTLGRSHRLVGYL